MAQDIDRSIPDECHLKAEGLQVTWHTILSLA